MSWVTVATTSSPVLAFFASTVFASCTGITVPGAIFVVCVCGCALPAAAGGCAAFVPDGLCAGAVCGAGECWGSVGGGVPGCMAEGCCACEGCAAGGAVS